MSITIAWIALAVLAALLVARKLPGVPRSAPAAEAILCIAVAITVQGPQPMQTYVQYAAGMLAAVCLLIQSRPLLREALMKTAVGKGENAAKH